MKEKEQRVSIVSGVNERIYQECYKPIFVDAPILPQGTIFSLYGTLREWLKEYHPQDWQNIKEKINKLKDKEYYLLADSYLHPIIPLLCEEDQDMLIKIGKQAYEEDFGFTPKGFWLPELAVSATTLKVLYKNGFTFLTLRDNQLKKTTQNPMYIPIKENNKEIGEIAVIHTDKHLSETILENHTTLNAEEFLHMFPEKQQYAIGTDTEVYGHYLSDKYNFLHYVTQTKVLKQNGFKTTNLKKLLNTKTHTRTTIHELSSWSCPHGIRRWTGTCLCDTTDKKIIKKIKILHQLTKAYEREINNQLDLFAPQWRQSFIHFFLQTRKAMYENGNIEKEIKKLTRKKEMKILKDQTIKNLFKAQLARLTAQTSCFGFFRDKDDRPEREITQINLEAIEKLLTPLRTPPRYNEVAPIVIQ